MALNKLMTVFEIHNYYLRNLCCSEDTFFACYGYLTPERMREAYPDRKWYE